MAEQASATRLSEREAAVKVWLITVGEPLPTDEGKNRLLRTGLLANTLAQSGHDVTWWTSTFDHWRKHHRFKRDTVLSFGTIKIVLLKGIGYRKNVSIRRLLDHVLIALRFSKLAATGARPDVILCSLPTLELALAAVSYGRRTNVPVVIDIRDLWPDIFLELAPARWRSLAKMLLTPLYWEARQACQSATAIIGNSPGFVKRGLRYASRSRGPWDRDFPFGYSERVPDDEARAQAIGFWSKYGLAERTERRFVVCFFGTLSRQFDLATAIAAARRLSGRGREFKFVFCGTGGSLEEYKRLTGDCPDIIFPGWVGAPEIWTLMRTSHAGLAPYEEGEAHRENLPNKPIEYFSAGLPVISSLSGYLKEVLESNDCGVTYRHRDVDSLVRALIALYDDRTRLRAMSENAYALYRRRFVAETVYKEMMEYLERVADHRTFTRPTSSLSERT